MNSLNTNIVLSDLLLIHLDRWNYLNRISERVWNKYDTLEADYNTMKKHCARLYTQLFSLLKISRYQRICTGTIYNLWKSNLCEIDDKCTINNLDEVTDLERQTIHAYRLALDFPEIDQETKIMLEMHLDEIKKNSSRFRHISEIPVKYK